MELKIKRKEVFSYWKIFANKEANSLQGRKWSYFLDKNESRLDSVLKEQDAYYRKQAEKRGKVSDEFKKEEEVLIGTYAQKDEKGNFLFQGSYTIPQENIDAYNAAREELYLKYGEEGARIKKYNENIDEYQEEEIIIDIHVIYEGDLPDNINGMVRKPYRDWIVEEPLK